MSVNILIIYYIYDILYLARGYEFYSIKPTKDINREADIYYVLNACYE